MVANFYSRDENRYLNIPFYLIERVQFGGGAYSSYQVAGDLHDYDAVWPNSDFHNPHNDEATARDIMNRLWWLHVKLTNP